MSPSASRPPAVRAEALQRASEPPAPSPAEDHRPAGDSGRPATRWLAGGVYLARSVAQSLRLMVGLPDYDLYLGHMERTHPDVPPMSYEAFFRERLEARYGAARPGSGRCC